MSSIIMASKEGSTYITGYSCEEVRRAEDSLDNYVLVWLEPELADRKSSFSVSVGLQTSVRDVRTFNDVERCLSYLVAVTEKRVFLVLWSKIDDAQLQRFQCLRHIELIYAFGWESIFRPEQSKLIHVTTIQELISRVSSDIRSYDGNDDSDFVSLGNANSEVLQGFKAAGDAKIFIFYQLVLEILLHYPKTSATKEQFISFCFEINQEKDSELKVLNEFLKMYDPSQAIKWYTRPCFLHRIFNRSCRIGDIKSMFKLVFFMADLYGRLKYLRDKYAKFFQEHIYVYRGRPMSTIEFDKFQNSIGDLVVTKSFLSATTDYAVARMYAGGYSQVPGITPAILKMKINKQSNESKPFAYIREESSVQDDDEVLMSIGMVFRLTESNLRDDIHEFTLLRGDQEEQVEREIKNTCLGRESESEASADIDILMRAAENDFEITQSDIKMLNTVVKSDTKSITIPNVSSLGELKTAASIVSGQNSSNTAFSKHMMKRVWKDVVSLKEGVGGKFILDSDPDNLERVSKVPVGFPSSERQDTIIIRGRILPTTYPYNLRSFRLEIVLPYDYPFKPPNMLLRSTIYHPNLDENGYLCIELLDFGREWSPVKTISKLVEAVADLIDKPRPDEAHCQQIVDEYLHHFEDFQIKALRDVLSFGDPRD